MWSRLFTGTGDKSTDPRNRWPKGNFGVLAVLLSSLFAPTIAKSADAYASLRITNGQILAPLERFKECAQCPEMIVIPLGSFMMGATQEESKNPFDFYGENATLTRRAPDDVHIIPHEHPRHRVEMDVPFALGRNEVTHAEWMECVDSGGCSHVPDHRVLQLTGYARLGPDHPVINISYLDMLEYVEWLNSIVGADVYRLPTEAEWEYAAKAGANTRFAQGEELTSDQANFSGAATENILGVERPDLTNRRMPVPVGELNATNMWGLRHMSGNVHEMTQSCWSKEHLQLTSGSAYLELSQTESKCRRALKGGAFTISMDGVRPATRHRKLEDRRTNDAGFRVARQLK